MMIKRLFIPVIAGIFLIDSQGMAMQAVRKPTNVRYLNSPVRNIYTYEYTDETGPQMLDLQLFSENAQIVAKNIYENKNYHPIAKIRGIQRVMAEDRNNAAQQTAGSASSSATRPRSPVQSLDPKRARIQQTPPGTEYSGPQALVQQAPQIGTEYSSPQALSTALLCTCGIPTSSDYNEDKEYPVDIPEAARRLENTIYSKKLVPQDMDLAFAFKSGLHYDSLYNRGPIDLSVGQVQDWLSNMADPKLDPENKRVLIELLTREIFSEHKQVKDQLHLVGFAEMVEN